MYSENLLKLVLVGNSNVGKSCLRLVFFLFAIYFFSCFPAFFLFEQNHEYFKFEKGDWDKHNKMTTIGVDFKIKTVEISIFKNKEKKKYGAIFKLQIWDTAGQGLLLKKKKNTCSAKEHYFHCISYKKKERFMTITSSYYRGAHGIIVVYDITNRASFVNVSKWIEQVQDFAPKHVCKLLVGNKIDLDDKRVVSTTVPFCFFFLSFCGQELANQHDMAFVETSAKLNTQVANLFATMAQIITNKWKENLPVFVNIFYFILQEIIMNIFFSFSVTIK
ncbi:ras-related protein Rab-1A [Reticulomyxa filosa]|uniref:Ras-related protein Rab-1A n=1 Tax=Reticulomyxa filosa TaxID=46433 RepID=X6NWA3_RETFI|nr:ras-related protein Rab-1A [Reticulomyxa filosa]|eukprot:ETO30163.1 ras-related protein Rab-1A [Reticulomyxa filosa]